MEQKNLPWITCHVCILNIFVAKIERIFHLTKKEYGSE